MQPAVLAFIAGLGLAISVGSTSVALAEDSPTFKQRLKVAIPNELNNSGLADAAVFSPDASQLVVTVNNNPLQVWDAVKGVKQFSIPIKAIKDDDFDFSPKVAWSPDTKALFVYQESTEMALYTLATKKRLNLPPQRSDHFQMRWFAADQAAYISGEFKNYELNIVKVAPWQLTVKVPLKENSYYDLEFSPDGTMIALAFENSMGIYTVDGKEVAKVDLNQYANCHQVAWSPDSKKLAQACAGSLLVYDLSNKKNQELERNDVSFTQAMSYTADGAKIIVAGGTDAAILEAATGKTLAKHVLEGQGYRASLSKSGLVLAQLNTEAMPAELTLTDLEIKLGPSLLPTVAAIAPPVATKPGAPAKPAPAAKPAAPNAATSRQWTSADGNFKVEASFVQANATHVQLKRKDNGQLLAIPIEKLSPKDQEYLQTLPAGK